jgi:hypothetical protein
MKFLNCFLASLFVALLLSFPTHAAAHRGYMLKSEVMPDHSYFIAVYDGPAVPTAAGQLPAATLTVLDIIKGDLNKIEKDAKTFSDDVHQFNRRQRGTRDEIAMSKGPGVLPKATASKAGLDNEPKKLRLESAYICMGTVAEPMRMPKPGTRLIVALGKRGWFYDLGSSEAEAKLRKKLKKATGPS